MTETVPPSETVWPDWSDPFWREPTDTVWRRGLRLLQGWWRTTHTELGPGHIRRRERPVVSMLPDGVGWQPNLMTVEAHAAAARAIARLRDERRPGIINEDRLKRNLLSSQPLCFNLFGYLGEHPQVLLPWVRSFAPTASSLDGVDLEWAPRRDQALGGSALDARIRYQRADGERGCLGVECKYAEDLKASLRKPAADKFRQATTTPPWKPVAVEHLDRIGLRQFWFNQLLTQRVKSLDGFTEVFGVVVACDLDMAARRAVADVSEALEDGDELRYSSIESILDLVAGHDDWKSTFRTRYLDFAPIRGLLPAGDPRKRTLAD